MPIRRDRNFVFVLTRPSPEAASQLAYGFQGGADAGDQSVLGQVSVDAARPANSPVIFGANRPKPARLSKVKTTGTESSYASDSSIATARGADWRVTSPKKFALPRQSKKQIAVYVQTNGLSGGPRFKYAWMMDKGDFAAFGEELGIAAVTANDEVAFGVNAPKPANVAKISSGRSTGSFVDDAKFDDAVTAGVWVVRKPGIPAK